MADRPGVAISEGDPQGLLHIWLSPAFPVSGFAYSQGLEAAVLQGTVNDGTGLRGWLEALAEHGPLGQDLIIMALIDRAGDNASLQEACALSSALQTTRERHLEAHAQGDGFRMAYRAGWQRPDALTNAIWDDEARPLTLAAAVALAGRDHAIACPVTLRAFAINTVSQGLSAAMRLSVIGQFEAQRITAALLPSLQRACADALTSHERDLGTATVMVDLLSMAHETQTVRVFRS
ncbi:MAG: urease accessory UreF family protein [Pseudomonadota bacterium]